MTDAKPKVLRRADYQPPPYTIETIHLQVELDGSGKARVDARLQVQRREGVAPSVPLQLDGVQLELHQVEVDGRTLRAGEFAVDAEQLTLPNVPARCVVRTVVSIDAAHNTSLEGLYKTASGYLTQCEAEGFRKITYYVDRPDVLARFTTELIAERARFPVLLANGNLQSSEDLGDGRQRAVFVDPFPKPCYLFAMVLADLGCLEDRFVTSTGRTVKLRFWAEPRNLDKCGYAMRSLQRAMQWDEATFGLACDLDEYSVVVTDDFNMGAMENKGLNIFNSQYVLASPTTASDGDYAAIEGVIGHEYFHNWTGNRVTCRDWFQLSLKEGLTVFRDQQFSAAMGSPATKRIEDVRRLRASQFPEDAGPMAHPVRPDEVIEINNFYTATVYEKGAEVVRMYHTLLGAADFRRGMDLYFQRHDGQAVTCDDFRAAMADASGRDLRQFERWYLQAGTPVLEVTAQHDVAQSTYTLQVRQSTPPTPGQPEKLPLPIPLAMALLGPDGAALPLRRRGEVGAAPLARVLELTEREQSFVFTGVTQPPVPSLLRGFSAPVHLRFPYSREQLAFLMAHDDDSFARWDAGQKLVLDVLLEGVATWRRDGRVSVPQVLLDACASVVRAALVDPRLDRALLAETLSLPSETMLGDAMTVVDVDAIHEVREQVRRVVAGTLRADLTALYQGLVAEEPATYSADAAPVARRSLKHVCLGYLLSLDDQVAWQLAERQLAAAANMTDKLSALLGLSHSSAPSRGAALEAFYQQFRSEPLVVDKWLRTQASAPRLDVLARVRELVQHPAFSLTNPNKVRALLGAFAANQFGYHAPGGAGYAFLADHILALDKLNPQIAARITAAAFSRWRRFDAQRQVLLRGEVERIAAAPALSRDVFEIASKIAAAR